MIISLIIDRFEGDRAVLKTNDGETIIWPKKNLPIDSREGAAITLIITGEKDKEVDSRRLAKNILNEILNSENRSE
jgi:hypothetical protein